MGKENQRRYYRAAIRLPARWRTLHGQETAQVEQGLGMSLLRGRETPGPIEDLLESASPGSQEEKVYRCVQYINNKLDFIIEQFFFKDTVDATYVDHVVEISGSGLRFESRQSPDPGTMIKMDLIVPGTYQFSVQLIAEVTRVEEGEAGFVTAARITSIEESARDAIVQIVFQRQRREIRSARSGRKEGSREG